MLAKTKSKIIAEAHSSDDVEGVNDYEQFEGGDRAHRSNRSQKTNRTQKPPQTKTPVDILNIGSQYQTPQKSKDHSYDPDLQSCHSIEDPNHKEHLVEKYLQISDFLQYIIDNMDVFIQKKLSSVKLKEEQRQIQFNYLLEFSLNVQDCCNWDKSVQLIIKNKFYKEIIN